MTIAKHVIIIGGGLAGLSAAWSLQQHGVSYTLLEASSRLGGMVVTDLFDGFVAEGGPESFITRKPELWQLALDLGLRDEIVPIASEARGTAILSRGRIMPVPLGPVPFLGSPLLSWKGKLRLLAEPFIRPRRDGADESLAEFGTRRIGAEASRQLLSPILSGIYSSDPATQSVQTTASVLREMESHGSLVRGMMAQGRARRALGRTGAELPPRSFTFKAGAQTLVDALARALTGELRTRAPVTAIERSGQRWRVATGDWLTADAVILATQANTAAVLLREIAPEAARGLAGITHEGLGTAALAFRASDVPAGLTGLMIPRGEGRAIDAVTVRTGAQAPASYALVRVFFGGGEPAMLALPDEDLMSRITDELRAVLDLSARPLGQRIHRWRGCFPKPAVGHLERVDRIEASLPADLALAGNSYRGLGCPDVVRSGQAAADKAARA